MIAAPTPSRYTPRTLVGYLLLLLATIGMQSAGAYQLQFLGAKPDFLLTLALCVGLLTDAIGGGIAGFLSGLMTAAISGSTVGTYLVTRTIAAWLVASVRSRFIRSGILVTLLGVAVGTIAAGVLFGLSVPRIGLLRWLTTTFISALCNTVVALPLILILRWLLPRR